MKIPLLFLLITISSVQSFRDFINRIPNGHNIPNPCYIGPFYTSEARWPGVGHKGRSGRGELNDFGRDFQASSHYWTLTLCRKDSDGDGMTNGEELGDPDCIWKPGMQLPITGKITHPGICDPIGSPRCTKLNSFLPCVVAPSSSTYKFNNHLSAMARSRITPKKVKSGSVFTSGRYYERLILGDVDIHRNTSLCPMLVGKNGRPEQPLHAPTSIADAVRCYSDSDCPTNYGCVNGPTNFYRMAICCPSTIEGQRSITNQPPRQNFNLYDHSYNRPSTTTTIEPTVYDNRCFSEPPILSNWLEPCRPVQILWYYRESSAACQPFYAYGMTCYNGNESYFTSRDECRRICSPNYIANSSPFGIHYPTYRNQFGGNYL